MPADFTSNPRWNYHYCIHMLPLQTNTLSSSPRTFVLRSMQAPAARGLTGAAAGLLDTNLSFVRYTIILLPR